MINDFLISCGLCLATCIVLITMNNLFAKVLGVIGITVLLVIVSIVLIKQLLIAKNKQVSK